MLGIYKVRLCPFNIFLKFRVNFKDFDLLFLFFLLGMNGDRCRHIQLCSYLCNISLLVSENTVIYLR